MGIISSILDQDQYKISMQNAVLDLFPNTDVEYRFINRGKQRFNLSFLNTLNQHINDLRFLSLSNTEYDWLKQNVPYFKPSYLEYLKNFRFNPSCVNTSLDEYNNLVLDIKGKWHETILFEVPLMAIISELYFTIIDNTWTNNRDHNRVKNRYKIQELSNNNCQFTDFGTRRRRSVEIHEQVIQDFCEYEVEYSDSTFCGTSNLKFAMDYDLRPIGTCAHEFCQAMSVLESLNHANYYMMQNWIKVYNTELGTVLTDTYTTDMFLHNFNRRMAMLFHSCRHDSGDPFVFVDKLVNHYKNLKIDPLSKMLIFSDGLDVAKAIEINTYCKNKIQCSFGIGTHFTNHGFRDSLPLNMVIKLWSVNDFPVVKLSDIKGKESGDPKAVETMKWIVKNQLAHNGKN